MCSVRGGSACDVSSSWLLLMESAFENNKASYLSSVVERERERGFYSDGYYDAINRG